MITTMTLKDLTIEQGDLYLAGRTPEDGEEVIVYDMWVQGTDANGIIWRHNKISKGSYEFPGNDDMPAGTFPNHNQGKEIGILYNRILETANADGEFQADPRYWVSIGKYENPLRRLMNNLMDEYYLEQKERGSSCR